MLAISRGREGGRKEVRNDLEVWPTALAVKWASRQIARERERDDC